MSRDNTFIRHRNPRSRSGGRERPALETENTRSGTGDRERPTRDTENTRSGAGGRERPAQETENTRPTLPRTPGGHELREHLESRPESLSVGAVLYLYLKFARRFLHPSAIRSRAVSRTVSGVRYAEKPRMQTKVERCLPA